MRWLLPDAVGTEAVVEAPVVCRGCTPPSPVADVACARCGDGPLLAGDLAAGNEAATVLVHDWLAGLGWGLSGPVCPDCVGELTR